MGYAAFAAALAAAVCAALPNPGMFVAMALGAVAAAAGWLGYRRLGDAGWCRLAGAAALPLATLGLALASARYALTLAALRRIEALFG